LGCIINNVYNSQNNERIGFKKTLETNDEGTIGSKSVFEDKVIYLQQSSFFSHNSMLKFWSQSYEQYFKPPNLLSYFCEYLTFRIFYHGK